MKNEFELNINKAKDIFSAIFCDINVCLDFVPRFLATKDLEDSSLTKEQINDLKTALTLLVANAKVEATRKMQQQYFMEVLASANTPTFNETFKTNVDIRIKFMELLIVFLDKSNLHDKDASHHIHIAELIERAAKTIR